MTSDAAAVESECVLDGIGVSPGVALGPAFPLSYRDDSAPERTLSEDEIPLEIARFEAAIIATRRQLADIHKGVLQAVGPRSAGILEVHMMVLDDSAFIEEVVRYISQMKVNCEPVIRQVSTNYAEALLKVGDAYLRERTADVQDVTRRILRNLCGQAQEDLRDLLEAQVIVAEDLAPSDTALFRKDRVIGFATDQGSSTSHTAIMARSLGIPAVVALGGLCRQMSRGETVLVDGTRGRVIVRPSAKTREEYGRRVKSLHEWQEELAHLRDLPAMTSDGHWVPLRANIELPDEVDEVLRHGAEGVGLFRSEYLMTVHTRGPDEHEQADAYTQMAARLAPHPVTIRTFDLGGDKFTDVTQQQPEKNPFLGFRAIRYCLAHPDFFKIQLRAILRASVHRNVRIMYPMVSSLTEVRQANDLLREAKAELRAESYSFDENIPVGIMIEIPSTALIARTLAVAVDFFSIGTNDLVQYTLAVDRGNERVATLYEPTHPAVLRLIEMAIRAAHEQKIPVEVCGEMGGSAILAPLLVGMGVDELSMVPSSVPVIKSVIRRICLDRARELAQQALRLESGAEVSALCRNLVCEVAPETLELVTRI
jgi:phosphotransferase system enzyme I (PtsI)